MTGADRASRRRPIAVIGALAVVIGALAASPVAAQSSRERSHVVRDGDTLARIARRYHVSVADLQRLNHLRGTQVRAGARLRVPSGDGTWRRTRARRATVRAGDTLTRIARRYHVSVEDLQTANHMRGTSVRPGQVLYVPMPGQSGGELYASMREGNPVRAPSEPLELPEDVEASARARADALGLGPTRVGQRLLMEAPDPRWIEAARAGHPEPLAGTLQLPVDGGVYLRGWGSGADAYHLAVDIGAPMGTDVHAAERGIVAYADHGIRGYGNFILIVHENGWVTAYAHARENLVVPGQLVQRGDVIAHVGQSGFARGPHVHFILVHTGEHCDPTPLFVPRIRRGNGDEVDEPTLVWDADHRPSGIRCSSRESRHHPHYRRRRRRR